MRCFEREISGQNNSAVVYPSFKIGFRRAPNTEMPLKHIVLSKRDECKKWIIKNE
jgi:hypothetical protein